MDHNQKTIILLGATGAAFLIWGILRQKAFMQQTLKKKQKLVQTQNYHRDAMIDYAGLKQKTLMTKKRNRKDLIYEDVVFTKAKAALNQYSFTRMLMSQSLQGYQDLFPDNYFMKSAVGGTFQVTSNNYTHQCHINDTDIAKSVLAIHKQPIIILPHSKVQSCHFNYKLTLKTAGFVAVYGRLSYDIEQKNFNLEAKCIATSVFQMSKGWNENIDTCKGKIAIGIFCLLFVSYLCLTVPAVNLYVRTRNALGQMLRSQINKFKKFTYFKSDPKWNLKCPKCKINSQEMVFDCGHLTFCAQCQSKGEKECPICKKLSSSFLRIFLG